MRRTSIPSSPPDSIPAGIRAVEIPGLAGKRYKHLFVATSSKAADALILQLKENSQMYTTQRRGP